VEDGTSEGIEPVELLPEAVRVETAAKVASALDEARTAICDSQRLAHEVLAELQGVVDLIAASITDSPDAACSSATSPAPTSTRTGTRST
jgi:hypothetical protein